MASSGFISDPSLQTRSASPLTPNYEHQVRAKTAAPWFLPIDVHRSLLLQPRDLSGNPRPGRWPPPQVQGMARRRSTMPRRTRCWWEQRPTGTSTTSRWS